MQKTKYGKIAEWIIKTLPLVLIVIWTVSAGLGQSQAQGPFNTMVMETLYLEFPDTPISDALFSLGDYIGLVGDTTSEGIAIKMIGWWWTIDVLLLCYDIFVYLIKTARRFLGGNT